MDEGVVRMAAQMYAYVAGIEALKIVVEGMKAANMEREHRGEALAYNEYDFASVAEDMKNIIPQLASM